MVRFRLGGSLFKRRAVALAVIWEGTVRKLPCTKVSADFEKVFLLMSAKHSSASTQDGPAEEAAGCSQQYAAGPDDG
jgi:hypothetical protein